MNMSKRTKILKLLLARRIMKRLRAKKRTFGIRSIFKNRLTSGEAGLVNELKQDPEYHKKYFRMSENHFEILLEKVRSKIQHNRTQLCPISPLERLAATLRWLATGNSQVSIGISYRISPASMCKILRETMQAICLCLEGDVLPAPSKETWVKSEEGFQNTWNFPNCCGALDGKHIRIRCPNKSGSTHFNYKGYFSIVLLAIVDPDYKFLAVDIGTCGSISDGGVLSRSTIGTALQNSTLELPGNKRVGNEMLPHVLVGDDAFPLRTNLLKPFPGRFLDTEKRIFNYRLSRARMVVENAFGILAARWRIFHTTIQADLSLVKLVVRTCVILHNFLTIKKDSTISKNATSDTLGNDSLVSVVSQGSNNYTSTASVLREKFKHYFNNEGAVPWQNDI